MKKRVGILLVVFTLICMLIPRSNVNAEEFYPRGIKVPQPIGIEKENEVSTYSSRNASYSEKELMKMLNDEIKEALLQGEKEVDIFNMNLDKDKYSYLGYMEDYCPYINHDKMHLSLLFSKDTNVYVSFSIVNDMTLDETKEYINEVDQKLKTYTDLIDDSMSDLTKIKIIHDQIVLNGEYEYDNLENNKLTNGSYSSNQLLMKNTAVCQGYACLFEYFMHLYDIDCYLNVSVVMSYMWNIVQLNDNYYHVDCTWDDPVRDIIGRVNHNYLLVSDDEMKKGRGQSTETHHDWQSTLKCQDTQYDNYYWYGVATQIIQDRNKEYYIKDGKITERENQNENTLYTINTKWKVYDQPGYSYTINFSRIFKYNDSLFYNDDSHINKYSLNDQSVSIFENIDTTDGDIYGMRSNKNKIQYQIQKSPNESEYYIRNTKSYTFTLPKHELTLSIGDEYSFDIDDIELSSSNEEVVKVVDGKLVAISLGDAVITATKDGITDQCNVTVNNIKYGDVNGDGDITISDAQMIISYIVGKTSFNDLQIKKADVNFDNDVTISDVQIIINRIVGNK
ncbi:dockerin type I domain-containing protein [Faecalibacillus faecis]|uniref:dockerin type I domain-containing protein n=1 Tax=Faecalibacillus faecis TaxID=1982628 RepID=UPI0022E5399E|nr:dockerin type I domain-containing protein [Faecalibacillus faecis]